jgi:hypothetical protein
MTDKSPTPDLMPRFQKPCHLDKTEHGTVGHDMASVVRGATDISRSPMGPANKNDKASHAMGTNAEPGLGAGGGRLGDAARSIKSGARTSKADWEFIRRG